VADHLRARGVALCAFGRHDGALVDLAGHGTVITGDDRRQKRGPVAP
jgi:hypothetical protein